MTKVVLFFALVLLLATLVSADFGVQIKHRDSGKRIDCTLGETTCFDYFFQNCMRDSVNNIMWNTIDTCRANEVCDNKEGCLEVKQEVFRPSIEEPKELPPWMECEDKQSKCSDDFTEILWCKNNKWEVRQVCSSDAICLNRHGCILKEEVKKEVSPERYAEMIGSQKKEELKEQKEEPIITAVQNQLTGGVVRNTIDFQGLFEQLKKLLISVIS